MVISQTGDFSILRMAAAAILDFLNFKILMARSRGSACTTIPNIVTIGQTVAYMWRSLIFQSGGHHELGFLKFRNFNGSEGSRWSNCFQVPNFVVIGQTAAAIRRFFKKAATAILNF